eukprot:479889-Rhodomonas_salina.3
MSVTGLGPMRQPVLTWLCCYQAGGVESATPYANCRTSGTCWRLVNYESHTVVAGYGQRCPHVYLSTHAYAYLRTHAFAYLRADASTGSGLREYCAYGCGAMVVLVPDISVPWSQYHSHYHAT